MKTKSRTRLMKLKTSRISTRLLPQLCNQDDVDVSPDSNDRTMDAEESREVDSLEVDNCVMCNGDSASRKLLVCSEMLCPISVHEECVCSKPVFDQLGHFYCPYCAYKRALIKTQKLRKEAMASKKVLSKFIDTVERRGDFCGCDGGQDGGGVRGQPVGGVEGDEPREGEIEQRREVENTRGGERVDDGEQEEEIVEDGPGGDNERRKGCNVEERTNEGRAHGGLDQVDEDSMRVSEDNEEQMQPEATGLPEDAPGEDNEPRKCFNVQEKTNLGNAHGGLDEGDEYGFRVSEENEEQMQPEEKEVPENGTVVSESDELDTGSPLVRKKRFKRKAKEAVSSRELPIRKTSFVEEVAKNLNEKAKTWSKNKETEVREFARKCYPPNGKRRRLNWTDEELQMLKEGVEIYATEYRKIPWRKILKFGANVFHMTRALVDITDKWRQFLGKRVAMPEALNHMKTPSFS